MDKPKVTDLSGFDEAGESLQLLLDRRRCALLPRIVKRIAEQREITIRPVNLVQIHVVGLQLLKAAIQCVLDTPLSYQAGASTYSSESAPLRGYLGRYDQFVARLFLEPTTKIVLGTALGLRFRRYGIHFRHVDEIDAA